MSHDRTVPWVYRQEDMTAVLPPAVASALGLLKPGDSAYLEVTGTQADGGVTVTAETESDDMVPPAADAAPMPAAPPELLSALGM